jgi:DNA-binding NarL/FixJ family response regulator
MTVVGEVTTFDSVLEIARAMSPDVLVTDLSLDGESLESVLADLQATGTRVLLLCDEPKPDRLTSVLFGGVSGYLLLRDAGPADLVDAVEAVARGDAALHPAVAAAILEHWRRVRAARVPETAAGNEADLHLTDRERQVLSGLADGLTTKAIAHNLGLALKTIDSHKARVFAKLHARTKAQAVAIALKNGLLTVREDEAGGRPLRATEKRYESEHP